jgi:hypothetical protein
MCYKNNGGQLTAAQSSVFTPSLFPKSYFSRLAVRDQCTECRGKISPGEAKTALGVCTVFIVQKTYQWATAK